MGRVTEAAAETAADASETVLRLAVLLQTGISPMRAWEQLAALGDPAAARVCASVSAGARLAEAIAGAGTPEPDAWGIARRRRRDAAAAASGTAWRDVAAAWQVAATVGAPLAESLRGVASALRDAQATRDEVRVALAEPASTARLMAWLPAVGALLGLALGVDTIGVMVTGPAGAACLIGGVCLVVAARVWTAALVRRARQSLTIPGIGAEVLAIALTAGVSTERAARLAGDALGEAPDSSARRVLALSRTAGAPAVELLRAAAGLARHRARTDARVRAARLSTRLLLPLGVCTLPAFLLLGVAPVLLAVMDAVPLVL